jgi:uncharacterized protein YtpQ (UPF0354 family)
VSRYFLLILDAPAHYPPQVVLYLIMLVTKVMIAAGRGENAWLRLVHQLDEGSIKLAPNASTSSRSSTIVPVVGATTTPESEGQFEKL